MEDEDENTTPSEWVPSCSSDGGSGTGSTCLTELLRKAIAGISVPLKPAAVKRPIGAANFTDAAYNSSLMERAGLSKRHCMRQSTITAKDLADCYYLCSFNSFHTIIDRIRFCSPL
ncbi:uncharacterized protein LOC120635389 [Pararge aegeria]|uniref:uncharacterized protein LOC120635389 n=1 Tax=Pararge aegeria TaxID=116150 RepID=UPI0019D26432|nr:uncharacterized protein LOC120635389 [Pararge aegeria]